MVSGQRDVNNLVVVNIIRGNFMSHSELKWLAVVCLLLAPVMLHFLFP